MPAHNDCDTTGARNRRRVPPPGGVRTRDRQTRLIGRPMRTSRPPRTIDRAGIWSAWGECLRREGGSNAASRSRSSARRRSHRGPTSRGRSRRAIRLARRGAHEPHVAATPIAMRGSASTRLLVARAGPFRRMNRRTSHLVAGWRTGLSRPVLILQGGNALNYFGYGLVLPLRSFISTRSVASRRRRPDWFSRRPWGCPQSSPRRRERCSMVFRQSDRGRRKLGERPWLRRLRLRRASLGGVCLCGCQRSRARSGWDGRPNPGRQVGHT